MIPIDRDIGRDHPRSGNTGSNCCVFVVCNRAIPSSNGDGCIGDSWQLTVGWLLGVAAITMVAMRRTLFRIIRFSVLGITTQWN